MRQITGANVGKEWKEEKKLMKTKINMRIPWTQQEPDKKQPLHKHSQHFDLSNNFSDIIRSKECVNAPKSSMKLLETVL